MDMRTTVRMVNGVNVDSLCEIMEAIKNTPNLADHVPP